MKLIVATPSFGGQIYDAHRLAVERLSRLCQKVGLEYDIITVSDTNPVRAHNDLAHIFLTRCWDATHLLFLHPYILFEARDILEMVALPHDVVGGVYPHPIIEWERCTEATGQDITPEAFAHPLVVDLLPGEEIQEDGTLIVKSVGLGAMCVKRSVLEEIVCTEYISDTGGTQGERVKHIFRTLVHDGKPVSMDADFCGMQQTRAFVRGADGRTINFTRIGTHHYRGSVQTRLGVLFT